MINPKKLTILSASLLSPHILCVERLIDNKMKDEDEIVFFYYSPRNSSGGTNFSAL